MLKVYHVKLWVLTCVPLHTWLLGVTIFKLAYLTWILGTSQLTLKKWSDFNSHTEREREREAKARRWQRRRRGDSEGGTKAEQRVEFKGDTLWKRWWWSSCTRTTILLSLITISRVHSLPFLKRPLPPPISLSKATFLWVPLYCVHCFNYCFYFKYWYYSMNSRFVLFIFLK